jgi:hypothetical protein
LAASGGAFSKGLLWLGRLGLVLLLPFWLLVRGSLLAHERFGTNAWLAVALGALAATLWIGLVAWRLWRRVAPRTRFRALATRVVLPCVVAFCVHALFYVQPPNVKSGGVAVSYPQVHPILRVALASLILLDSDVVITDMARRPGDYGKLGLPERARSSHYPQSDGWVHAVDLRTRGRGLLRVWLMRLYFWGMGFESLRHGGSADHLHVSLPGAVQRG